MIKSALFLSHAKSDFKTIINNTIFRTIAEINEFPPKKNRLCIFLLTIVKFQMFRYEKKSSVQPLNVYIS